MYVICYDQYDSRIPITFLCIVGVSSIKRTFCGQAAWHSLFTIIEIFYPDLTLNGKLELVACYLLSMMMICHCYFQDRRYYFK